MRDGVAVIGTQGGAVTFYPNVAEAHFSARWRGFLTIDRLREVYRNLAHQLAECFQSRCVIWVPDYFERGDDFAAAGGTIDDIQSALIKHWGPPQGSLESISPDVISAAEHYPPDVWFLESRMAHSISQPQQSPAG